eukprot:5718865-Prymnesium_polylepis.1
MTSRAAALSINPLHCREIQRGSQPPSLSLCPSRSAADAWHCGLLGRSVFTHLAPLVSDPAARIPSVMRLVGMGLKGSRTVLHDKPLYVVAGQLDLPDVDRVEQLESAEALRKAGARVTFVEKADLGHAFPREETGAILEWLVRTPPQTDVGPTRMPRVGIEAAIQEAMADPYE